MAKKIETKYIYFVLQQATAFCLALGAVITCIYFLIIQYGNFFESTNPEIFWMGFLLVGLIILSSAVIAISSALIVKNFFYIKMGYEFDKNENKIYSSKKEVKHD